MNCYYVNNASISMLPGVEKLDKELKIEDHRKLQTSVKYYFM